MLHEITNRIDVPVAVEPVHPAGVSRRNEIESPTESESAADQEVGVDSRDVEQAVARINHELRRVETRLQFEIDRNLNRVIIKIMNGESGEIIRQIPTQEALDLAKSLGASKGVLLNQQA